eukprot:jgi/Hompol1/6433/HPOL_002854-RA
MNDFFLERFSFKRLSTLAFTPKVTPAALLARFKNNWEAVLSESKSEQSWRKSIEHTNIPSCLKSILDILVKEQSVPDAAGETGVCTEHFFKDDILGHLVTLSENDVPLGYRTEAIRFTSNLIDLINPRFLFNNRIHRPIVRLIENCMTSKDFRFHDAMLELEVNLCTKIQSTPELMQLFFDFTNVSYDSTNLKYKFSLLDHVMVYIDEGRVNGDRARTACPILFALAQDGDDLENYILTKHYPILIVAGLSGVFAELPAVMPDASGSLGSEHSQAIRRAFSTDIKRFVDYIGFTQSVLATCPSKKINDSILEHTRSIFFSTVLLPTLKSGSDFDGTVLTAIFYLQQLASTITDPGLSALFVDALLGNGEEDEAMRRHDNELSLSVRDVLISKINSISEDIVTATLHLLYTLMRDHPQTTFPLLFEKLPSDAALADVTGIDKEVDINISWIQEYRLAYLLDDALAGFTLGTVLVPQSMGYAAAVMANLPPVQGLFTSSIPHAVYFFFGASPYNSIAPFAVTALMTGDSLVSANTWFHDLRLSECEACTNTTAAAVTAAATPLQDDIPTLIAIASLQTFLIGIILLLLLVTQLYKLLDHLASKPMVDAFTVASSFSIATSQLRHMLGLSIPNAAGPGSNIVAWTRLLMHIMDVNLVAVALSVTAVGLLIMIPVYEPVAIASVAQLVGMIRRYFSRNGGRGNHAKHSSRYAQLIGETEHGGIVQSTIMSANQDVGDIELRDSPTKSAKQLELERDEAAFEDERLTQQRQLRGSIQRQHDYGSIRDLEANSDRLETDMRSSLLVKRRSRDEVIQSQSAIIKTASSEQQSRVAAQVGTSGASAGSQKKRTFIPHVLVTISFITMLSYALDLPTMSNVAVIGYVQQGLPSAITPWSFPSTSGLPDPTSQQIFQLFRPSCTLL